MEKMRTKIAKTGTIVFSPFQTLNVAQGSTIELSKSEYQAAFAQGYTKEKEFIAASSAASKEEGDGSKKKGTKEKPFSKRPGKNNGAGKGSLEEENKDRTKQ